MFNVRTDLAVEKRELYEKRFKREIDGIIIEEENIDDIKVTTVDIIDENGAQKMGKGIGRYITIEMPICTSYDVGLRESVSHILAGSLERIINLKDDDVALVVGLGNSGVTPDALGPKVVEKIIITRHLNKLMPDEIEEDLRSVCAISPGVLGTTGIETAEIIKSIVDKIKPAVVICVDALASRSLSRVSRSIQISDTGISPGGGVANKRMEINEENLGIPVIAVGVPTVVDAGTIANDAIDLVIDEMIEQSENKEFYTMLKNIDKSEKSNLIRKLLNPYVGDLMVTPKEIDEVVECISKVVANGINIALQPNMDSQDILEFLN
ncbi:MAG: GPR endopeptidase [Sarcina sp.]